MDEDGGGGFGVLVSDFATARLRMRAPVAGDAPALLERWVCDAEATRFLLFSTYSPGDIAAVQAFLGRVAGAWRTRSGHLAWLICESASDTPIGMIGVTLGQDGRSCEIGYVIARPWQGKGYAVEALCGAVATLMADQRVWRVFATTHLDNHKSQRVLTRAGFTREGTLRRYHVFPNIGPEPQACTLWSFTRDDLEAEVGGDPASAGARTDLQAEDSRRGEPA